MENFNLMFTRMNDLSLIQQEVKKQLQETNQKVDQCTAEQHLIVQQVRANEQAVAQLTVK